MRAARSWISLGILVTAVISVAAPRQVAAQDEALNSDPKEQRVRSAADRQPRPLYRLAGRTIGQPLGTLDPRGSGSSGPGNGRVTPLDRRSFNALRKAKKEDLVLLPLTDRQSVKGRINIVLEDAGYVRIGGALGNRKGSFFLSTNGTDVSGLIQLVRDGVAFQVEDGDGKLLLREVRRSDVVSPAGPQP